MVKTTRRGLLAMGTAGTIVSLTGSVRADESHLSEAEAAHTKIVNDFCAAWSTLDAEKIASFVSDKVVYQMIDGMPLIKGKEGLTKFIAPFLSKMSKAEWEIKRTYAIGNIVINERVDNFYSKTGKDDAHFDVSGFFLIKEGKILEWKDYRLPKAEKKA